MEYVAIFEGGGAKGLAHVGALKAAEERGISFKAVGGTSAGAIMATFVAAGFSADELFNPHSPETGLLSKNFLDFLDADYWTLFQKLQKTIGKITKNRYRLILLPYYRFKYRRLYSAIADQRGVFDTEAFQNWLGKCLKDKLQLDEEVTFGHLENLTIISTDVGERQTRVFSKRTPKVKIAEAVSASIAIPFFFRPKQFRDESKNQIMELVDGGMVSNYPAWIFDEERLESEAQIATIGFKLLNKFEYEGGNASFFNYLLSLMNAAIWGDQSLETRGIENLHSIPLRVTTGTLEFDLNAARKKDLYNEGKDCAALYFSGHIGVGRRERISDALKITSLAARGLIQGKMPPQTQQIHLRANIFAPTFQDSKRLRLMYSFNMEGDADDKLIIRSGSGAAGVCYETKKIVLCDLVKARQTFQTEWKLNKYQQALVRQSLKSLISIPIFGNGKEVVAVLSFDSDDDILAALHEAALDLAEIAPLIHKSLY